MTVRRRHGDERGQITAMLAIFAICLLLAISAVTDIAGSYLRRQAATSLADGAALSASDAAAAGGVYGPPDAYVVIDQAAAAAAVETYLEQTGAHGTYPGLRAEILVEDETVFVYISMPYELPVTLPGVQSTTTIHASGSAVMPVY